MKKLGCAAAVLLCVLFLSCAGLFVLSASVASKLPNAPQVKQDAPKQPAQDDDARVRQGASEFLAISDLPPGDERTRKLQEWQAKYPDLWANYQAKLNATNKEGGSGYTGKTEHVSGYTKKNGTVVAPYNRRPK